MRSRYISVLLAAALTAACLIGPASSPAIAAPVNLAAGKAVSASTVNGPYAARNVNDGNQGSYWESANDAFPQWIQVDLGASVDTEKVVLRLPASGWGERTQTLAVQGSLNGTSYTDLVRPGARVFSPAQNNTVTLAYGAAQTRYLRIAITANTGWPAGQLSELEVYGPESGDQAPPTAPSGLAYTEPGNGQIRLTWGASSDAVGVTGYDVYANDVLRGSVAGNVLAYTDTQPASATVAYHVKALDAAGNLSAPSNTVVRQGQGGGTNLAAGKPVTASSTIFNFLASNANDGSLATYWESAAGAYPATLTVGLGGRATLSSVAVKLNPDAAWGPRTQNIEVLGRNSAGGEFTTLKAAQTYTFDPASGNGVSIPVTGTAAEVRLRITSNSGATGAQAAEFQVFGTPAPTPDLSVSDVSWTPAAPVETDTITLRATVRNHGTGAADASTTDFLIGGQKAGSAATPALAAGASAQVTASIGTRDAGSYAVAAKADAGDDNIEPNETDNQAAATSPLVVKPVPSSDVVASAVTWNPGNPSAGNTVTFSVTVKNEGTVATAGGSHGVVLTLLDGNGGTVRTLNGSYSGVLAPGQSTAPLSLGTWTAANGRYSVRVVLADDANELPVKRANNTSTRPFHVGRGASMPYDHYEAEDGALGGGAQLAGPSIDVGTVAGEASGRRAVTLNSTGASVEFTTKASTNTLVTRFSIPDAPGGGGITSTLNVYVDGTFLKPITLSSRHAWLYGNETNPGNAPVPGQARHIYDEAHLLLGTTVPAGSRIKLQKDAANTTTYAIDFVNTEQVAQKANPDPARYAVPAGFTHQDVQNALDKARQDPNLVGVYLPAGDYQTSNKFQVYGKAVKVVGAGVWFTRFHAPAGQENTDVGFRADATANGSTFASFAYFGNYTSRIDGPGKVFDFQNVSDIVIDDIWAEHMVCLYWGANTDRMTIKNARIRDMFADGLNMTNGSTDNLVTNSEARSTGDDGFALFSAIDAGGADMKGNVYENLTAITPWRAAGVAVYGGYDNVFRNIHVADTLVYSGITISSLDFGYPMNGFGFEPKTRFENISIVRAGGHFWGDQTFPGIWLFSASKVFQGIRVSNVDIVDPSYSGIMFQTNYVGGQPQNPVTDTVLTDVSITGAKRSGDAWNEKSGFGIWVNEMPEAGQGPAVGEATFNGLRMSGNHQDIRNTTTTFKIIRNP
ncbi:discoidin domain-containing protein [Spirillospora sp. NPDC047279]|uniref:discoidin domain-containing protein n=1 Tax=Spirillospora sp. NPDC047279 TaxID=3155478 RepID=UPI0033DBCC6F